MARLFSENETTGHRSGDSRWIDFFRAKAERPATTCSIVAEGRTSNRPCAPEKKGGGGGGGGGGRGNKKTKKGPRPHGGGGGAGGPQSALPDWLKTGFLPDSRWRGGAAHQPRLAALRNEARLGAAERKVSPSASGRAGDGEGCWAAAPLAGGVERRACLWSWGHQPHGWHGSRDNDGGQRRRAFRRARVRFKEGAGLGWLCGIVRGRGRVAGGTLPDRSAGWRTAAGPPFVFLLDGKRAFPGGLDGRGEEWSSPSSWGGGGKRWPSEPTAIFYAQKRGRDASRKPSIDSWWLRFDHSSFETRHADGRGRKKFFLPTKAMPKKGGLVGRGRKV